MLKYPILENITKYLSYDDKYNLLCINNDTYAHIDLYYNKKIIDCNKIILSVDQKAIFSNIVNVKNSNDLVKYMPNVKNDKEEWIFTLLNRLRGYFFRMKINDYYPITKEILDGYDNILEEYIKNINNEDITNILALMKIIHIYTSNIYCRMPHELDELIQNTKLLCLHVTGEIDKFIEKNSSNIESILINNLANIFIKKILCNYGNFPMQ